MSQIANVWTLDRKQSHLKCNLAEYQKCCALWCLITYIPHQRRNIITTHNSQDIGRWPEKPVGAGNNAMRLDYFARVLIQMEYGSLNLLDT